MDQLSAGDVWTIVAASLVLFMTPGLAFFYGGMTRVHAALNMILMSFVSIGLVGVVWVLWGSSMATTPSAIPGIVGNPAGNFGLVSSLKTGDLLSVGFSATFAIITVSLISGSIADRTKFGTWCVFVPLWITLVYAPLAFMVWADLRERRIRTGTALGCGNRCSVPADGAEPRASEVRRAGGRDPERFSRLAPWSATSVGCD